jgi:MFS family permease
VVGFYAALGPTTMRQDVGITDTALISLIVAELFVVAAVVIVATQRWRARKTMLTGLAATPIGMALLVLAQQTGSLLALIAGTAVCGVAGALGYRGGLAVANGLAPPERRAEVASAFFICCFCGNAVPIIGIGVLARMSTPRFADAVFAIVVTAIAFGAAVAAFAATSQPTSHVAG